jgi:FHS family Na+ dependent glucose MFS transporter 1
MQPIQSPSARQRQTTGYFALFVYMGLGSAVLGPTLPALAQQVGRPVGDMGLLFLAGSLGFTAGTALGARIFDRVPGHLVLAVAQIFSLAMLALYPFAPSLEVLASIIAVRGLADGAINTGGNTLLVWTHGDNVGPYMSALHFFFGVGAFVSPLLVAQVVNVPGGYRWAYWILASIAVLIGVWLLTLRGGPRPHGQPAGAGSGRQETRPAVTRLTHPVVLSAFVFLFFYVGAEIAYGGWLYTYATQLHLADVQSAAYLTSAFWLSFTIGRLLSIPMATRLRAMPIVFIGLGGCLAALGVLMAVPGSSVVLWAVTVGLGFFIAPIYATGFTLAGQSVTFTARVGGVILLGDSLGGMLLPWLVGPVIGLAGPRALIYLVFGSLVCCTLAFLGLLRAGRKRHHVVGDFPERVQFGH